MNNGPEWFAPKSHGYGSGMPIAWQGWALLIGYLAIVAGAAYFLQEWPPASLAIILTMTAFLLIVAAKTTRGGWRWRWGKHD